MAPKNVYFVGTAGCGKSTLTYAFQSWLQKEGVDAITVNLDPGAENLLYPPDVDVRDWIRLSEVMDNMGLGPNGAQVAAADMLALNVKEIAEVVSSFDPDYILIDTPGQLELFTFRQSSRVVIEELGGDSSVLAFMFDPALAKTPNGYVSSLMLASTVHFRFPVPMALLLAKSDLLSESEADRIEEWGEDSQSLFNDLLDESKDNQTQMSIEFLQALDTIGAGKRVVPVSADTYDGLADLYAMVQGALEGGEDVQAER
jgi:GTPase SAR1 family protein